ncbi:class II aldolase/adducin family protein [Achromobacter sp. GG226]|uniref:class II aldolase/adducin family protein n=1 Tax=Verticiella alkaliphila TaxID=2779529 RepID=UPI001C0DD432|nr:class II aldolase/adducin family protein [Verticiella sp. GG226]MBU4612217.1 class II aldolase/adducin family protein [Verticiella sp. GG226]
MTEPATLQHVVHEDEWRLRVELAACYRLVAMYGMSDLIFTHISAKLPESVTGGEEQFLINPYGMFFDEITASSLVRIDMEGNKLSDSPYEVNRAGFVIHSTIHEARPDVGCVIHTHTRAGVGVSAQRDGLLPISQQSTFITRDLAYHDYQGLAVNDEERVSLVADLGTHNYLMLRNHGLLVAGKGVPQAFVNMYFFETACQIQLAAQSGGAELTQVTPEVLAGVGQSSAKMRTVHPGLLAWPGLLRRLDRLNPGYDS